MEKQRSRIGRGCLRYWSSPSVVWSLLPPQIGHIDVGHSPRPQVLQRIVSRLREENWRWRGDLGQRWRRQRVRQRQGRRPTSSTHPMVMVRLDQLQLDFSLNCFKEKRKKH